MNASASNAEHMAGAGIAPDVPVVVAGLETEKEFTRVMLDDQLTLDVETARQEHLTVTRRMMDAHPEIGAIVLECTNMPPYRADIQAADRRARVRHHHAGPHGARGGAPRAGPASRLIPLPA